MTIVTAQMSESVDGFYAGPEHTGTLPWLEGAEAAGLFRVTRWVIDAEAWRQRLGFRGGEQHTNCKVIAETFEAAGAYVMGRRMADGGEVPWGDEPPFRAPVFVVTHQAREPLPKQGGTTFTFVTDGIEAALDRAKAAAGDRDIRIGGGVSTVRQYLKAGLIDEMHLAMSPVVLGRGEAMFAGLDLPALGFTVREAVASPLAMHVVLAR